MSRVSYSEDEDFPGQWALGAKNLERSLAGAKGQAALRDLETALLTLPQPRLIRGAVAKDGEVCAVGAVVAHRKVSLGAAREAVLAELEGEPDATGNYYDDDYDDGKTEAIGVAAGIPKLVAWRMVALNDLDLDMVTPEVRFERVLAWTRKHLKPAPSSETP